MTDLIAEARAVIEAERCVHPDEPTQFGPYRIALCVTHSHAMANDGFCFGVNKGIVTAARDLLAVVEAVTALADQWAATGAPATRERQAALRGCARRLRAALTPKED